ncbi:MAG: hypothetical protein IMZ69_01780 [Spirochaetes bacterium]|nr:hypothetical protein [Spirochaetota bacterium]
MRTMKRRKGWPSWANYRAVCNPVNSCGEGFYSALPAIHGDHWQIPNSRVDLCKELTSRKSSIPRRRRWHDHFTWRWSLRRIV